MSKPVRMRSGLVSLGTRYSEFYWWDPLDDTLWGDYDDVMRGDWRRLKITEAELPAHCRETLKVARQWVAEGKKIPSWRNNSGLGPRLKS